MATSKNKETALATQLIAGTVKRFLTVGSLTFANGSFTPAEVEGRLKALVDLRTAVDAAKNVAKAKIVAEAAQAPSLRSHMAAYVAFVKATFGNSPDALADFGLNPKKVRAPLTIEQRATAVAKRAARHTMGSQQKKSAKGTITTIVSPRPTDAPTPVAPKPVVTSPSQGNGAGAAPHAA